MSELIDIEHLYENAPCGYFSFVPDGKIIKANKTFQNWIGISSDEVTDLRFVDLLYKGSTIYYEMIFLPMLKMQGFLNEINFDIVKKDKTTFPGLINAVAVRDDKHNLKAVNVTLINITDRKNYERELITAKEEANRERIKFEILSNQVPTIIWTANDIGQIDFINKQYYKLTQNQPAKDKKLYICDLVTEDHLSSLKKKWDEARQNNTILEQEVRLKDRTQNPTWYLLRAIPFIKDHFAVETERSWLGTLTDINLQMKALQMKDDFISIASHELKTPITVIKSYLQILREVSKDAHQITLINKCESGVSSMHQLINHLLDTSNISSEELTIHKKRVDLFAIIKDCIAAYEFSKTKHKILLRGDLQPVFVFADKIRLEQVINNLLSNAIKYSPDTDKVIVSIDNKKESGKVIVSVKDFGSDINKIFDRYFRVKSRKSDRITGWGLGLFIIQQIIKSHNSVIEVESEVGKGSCFSFAIEIMD